MPSLDNPLRASVVRDLIPHDRRGCRKNVMALGIGVADLFRLIDGETDFHVRRRYD
jgi:hypothetical protein